MTRANEVSSRVFSLRRARTGVAMGLGVLLLSMAASGCGWIFGKQKKPMLVEVELTATDSLNFDGVRAQAVQLKIYLLKDDARFVSGDTRAFFDDKWNPEWREQVFHKQDTMAMATVTIIPNEVKMVKLQIPYAYARDAKPMFAVIADFLYPPSTKTERLSFQMQKRSKQKIKLSVGKNWVIRPGKK